MKRVLTESSDNKREEEAEKRQQLSETFRTAPFNELMRRTQPKVQSLYSFDSRYNNLYFTDKYKLYLFCKVLQLNCMIV